MLNISPDSGSTKTTELIPTGDKLPQQATLPSTSVASSTFQPGTLTELDTSGNVMPAHTSGAGTSSTGATLSSHQSSSQADLENVTWTELGVEFENVSDSPNVKNQEEKKESPSEVKSFHTEMLTSLSTAAIITHTSSFGEEKQTTEKPTINQTTSDKLPAMALPTQTKTDLSPLVSGKSEVGSLGTTLPFPSEHKDVSSLAEANTKAEAEQKMSSPANRQEADLEDITWTELGVEFENVSISPNVNNPEEQKASTAEEKMNSPSMEVTTNNTSSFEGEKQTTIQTTNKLETNQTTIDGQPAMALPTITKTQLSPLVTETKPEAYSESTTPALKSGMEDIMNTTVSNIQAEGEQKKTPKTQNRSLQDNNLANETSEFNSSNTSKFDQELRSSTQTIEKLSSNQTTTDMQPASTLSTHAKPDSSPLVTGKPEADSGGTAPETLSDNQTPKQPALEQTTSGRQPAMALPTQLKPDLSPLVTEKPKADTGDTTLGTLSDNQTTEKPVLEERTTDRQPALPDLSPMVTGKPKADLGGTTTGTLSGNLTTEKPALEQTTTDRQPAIALPTLMKPDLSPLLTEKPEADSGGTTSGTLSVIQTTVIPLLEQITTGRQPAMALPTQSKPDLSPLVSGKPKAESEGTTSGTISYNQTTEKPVLEQITTDRQPAIALPTQIKPDSSALVTEKPKSDSEGTTPGTLSDNPSTGRPDLNQTTSDRQPAMALPTIKEPGVSPLVTGKPKADSGPSTPSMSSIGGLVILYGATLHEQWELM